MEPPDWTIILLTALVHIDSKEATVNEFTGFHIDTLGFGADF